VKFENRIVVPVTDQTITCLVSDLSQNTPVTWIGPDDQEISESDKENYAINQGEYVLGTKTATLIIKAAKISTLSSGSVFKCKLKSSQYPTNSPDVVKEMELSFYTFGNTLI
jgi:hypothetical protein